MKGAITIRRGADTFTRGWLTLTVDTSIEDACSVAAVTFGGRVAASDNMIIAGEDVTVFHDGEAVFTGSVMQVAGSEGASESRVQLDCRSKTADIVDCSGPVGSWRAIRFADLLAIWLTEYEVGVVFEAADAATAIIKRIRTQPGEQLFDSIDSIARDQRVLICDDELGRLVVTRAAATAPAVDAVVVGLNVLDLSWTDTLSERFSEIECRGQTSAGEVDAVASGTFRDRRVKRHRRLVVVPEKGVTKAEAAARAAWEALTRAGRAMQRTYTVSGWRQASGALWRRNMMVNVTDPRRGHVATPLLITGVNYSLGPEGERATLTLAPASAFTPEPIREPRSGKGGSTSRWSKWDAGGVE